MNDTLVDFDLEQLLEESVECFFAFDGLCDEVGYILIEPTGGKHILCHVHKRAYDDFLRWAMEGSLMFINMICSAHPGARFDLVEIRVYPI